MDKKKIKIGMIGLGTVGSGVWTILNKHRSLLKNRVGVELEIAKIAVRSKRKKRTVQVPSARIINQIEPILKDPEIDLIVEVMGDVETSRRIVLQAIQAGKHVVTANKALLALHGPEIFMAAKQAQVDICFEGAVGGGIPILRALREGLVGNQIQSIYGIVNGTCNYILSEMEEKASNFKATLTLAQKFGYAEADPSFDVGGIDAAHKLAILLSIAYGVLVDFKQIHVEGIEAIAPIDLEFARRFGFSIKLLAIIKSVGRRIQARVHPTMIPRSSMLAAVHGVNNAVLLEGDFVGPAMLYGKGAGSEPTASAVVGDIVEVARNILAQVNYTVPPLGIHEPRVPKALIEPMEALRSSYYLRIQVIDKPGVLARITQIFNRHRISISSFYQNVREEGAEVPIVVITHEAVEKDIKAAVQKINRLAAVRGELSLIRIEEKVN